MNEHCGALELRQVKATMVRSLRWLIVLRKPQTICSRRRQTSEAAQRTPELWRVQLGRVQLGSVRASLIWYLPDLQETHSRDSSE